MGQVLTSYCGLKISKPDDYLNLTKFLDLEFGPEEIGRQLKKQITAEVKFILIEFDYIDKDYRSTFYNFYSKKGRRYRDDCVRIHFFDDCVGLDEQRMDLTCSDEPKEDNLKDHYFGYIVLRPTIVATLGRSILSPRIRVGAQGRVIRSHHSVHLLGYTFNLSGFPSMAQHADIAVCAHVSCWSILRHYSEQFSAHREILLHEITRLATPFDPGGLAPSFGLDIVKAERIFQSAGCFPITVYKRDEKDLQFYAQLLAYLESGFPLFVAMTEHEHAIVAIGHDWRATIEESPELHSHVWSWVDTLLVVDDNLLPYRCINLKEVSALETQSDTYTAEDFDAFIAPLPEKIYYPADAVERFSSGILYSSLKQYLGLPDEQDLVRRYFVTTISALRRFARNNQSQMGDELVNLIMRLRTAQFVWIVEYADHAQWSNKHIATRAIIDATASPNELQPVWLIHNDQQAIVFDRSSADEKADVIELKRPINIPLGSMQQNLRPVQA